MPCAAWQRGFCPKVGDEVLARDFSVGKDCAFRSLREKIFAGNFSSAKSQILGAGSQDDARLLRGILGRSGLCFGAGNPFDCARWPPFSVAQGRKGTLAMFETMTAVMGLVGAAIFLAHAFEGIRSRV
jgi:hypothetical protein